MHACRTSRFIVATLPALGLSALLAACGGDGGDDRVVASTRVSAAQGATLSGDGGAVVVTIPAGALSQDTTVTIRRTDAAPTAASALPGNGRAYEVAFDAGATLSVPMSVELAAAAAPSHPQLGEIASLSGTEWVRLPANFFRTSDRRVVGLTKSAGTFAPVLRTLQAASGAGVERGKGVFLYETFGNEDFFGGALRLHELLNNLTPAAAVAAGVQVDLDKVPAPIVQVLTGTDLAAKDAALQDPSVTRTLIQAGAVVGVKGVYGNAGSNMMTSAGITCALCHVNVKPTTFSLSAGLTPLPIGPLSLDGKPNLAMNAGAILSLTPFVQSAPPAVAATLQGWSAGRFDVRALPDNPLEDNVDNPTSVPPLWNFVDLERQLYAYNWDGLFKSAAQPGDALASQAEAVYDLVMHANGAFGTAAGSVAPQLAVTPPPALLDALGAAETAAPGNVITPDKLRDVQEFQRSIVSPAPGAYDEARALKGFQLFNGKANCIACHSTAEFTGRVVSTRITLTAPAGGLAGGIKTPGLRGVASTAPYFHDGSAATLRDVMNAYSGRIVPTLSDDEKDALVEYMKAL